ncbi:glycosyltransferase [Lentisalinibacter salinarum]|uniref:glycosyltransferase n=1 Tax=Lentisalinibacter salinarum TaxID=2992239 RepID=UPI0038658EEE
MPRVLMVAYHFPPHSGTSGVQRALRFSSYLPDFGWDPIVLTAHPGVYDHRSPDLLAEVRDDMPVIRAPALDARKHLAIAGRYPAVFARPDRWRSWWWGAVPAGLIAIRRFKPDAIWSTYPIATAHRISCTLARLTRLPLVADFRDPMAQEGYPSDPATWRSFERIERRTVGLAARSVFTTPGARESYRRRYPAQAERFEVIENGYDEKAFEDAPYSESPLTPRKMTLLHSGVIYPAERDPNELFAAIAMLKKETPELFGRLLVRFRASMADRLLYELAERYDVSTAVEICGAMPYREALGEMQAADGLLILQASSCNEQIPAKFYEYLRARRPLILLSDSAGDTAHVARQAGIDDMASLHDRHEIFLLLKRFLNEDKQLLPSDDAIAAASRYARTKELASVLDKAIGK